VSWQLCIGGDQLSNVLGATKAAAAAAAAAALVGDYS